MKIQVELQAYLDQYAPNAQPAFVYDLPDGSAVKDLISALGIPFEVATVVIVGKNVATMAQVLHDGDKITVIPPLAGG